MGSANILVAAAAKRFAEPLQCFGGESLECS